MLSQGDSKHFECPDDRIEVPNFIEIKRGNTRPPIRRRFDKAFVLQPL
jgi:hypothetical protein